MMMTLGLFVFQLQTLPYQTMLRTVDYRWPSNSRIGQRPALQFLGVNEEKITLSGALLPEITGGKISLQLLDVMAAEGKAWPLLEGTGTIYGMFVVNNVSETRTEFFSDGSARRIEFSLTLTRVDESLTAMYGDLRSQAESLLGRVGGLAGELTGGVFS
ncbi:Phage protein U [Serratia ficaria]|uniref:phage tail protein n=1 Tax=Serratia ficaria TaxID=61651 RepID=UPI00217C3C53|nr:phage tail protein [Serratia ficaria]CAI1106851.1 Phage protein U [Serratia ficaria]CAI1809655.1 Phage protein U [Serratia ficaria]CAI2490045.1 Phage protein U [Serratia ficaria]CAI2511796.1 Phage protein U [Serratia ficaria]CAI2791721.1 Phage protein U [Serratia ficaria]